MRDHIASIERQTGRKLLISDEEPAEVPPVLWYLWEWYGELAAQRTSHGMGPNPITHSDLLAWAALQQISPTPEEAKLLLRLDREQLATLRTERTTDKES